MDPRLRIATAMLVRDGMVLLGRRSPSREAYPSCWALPGGHVEPDESPDNAVRRECREELGVEIHDLTRLPLTVADPRLDMHTYVVTHWSGEIVNATPREHDELRWFQPDELDELTLAHAEMLAAIQQAMGACLRGPDDLTVDHCRDA